MEHAIKPPSRFSNAGCTVCCMRDIDGDGFITKEELGQEYDNFCEQDENGIQSISCDSFSIVSNSATILFKEKKLQYFRVELHMNLLDITDVV